MLLEYSPFASPFQTPEFYDFYNSLATSYAEVFAIEEEGSYLALLVLTVQKENGFKAYFSRRGIAYGGVVLLPRAETDAIHLLLTDIKHYYQRKLIYLEIRNNFDYGAYTAPASAVGFDYVPWLNFQFPNISPSSFREGMTKARQRQLSQAQKLGVTWREARSEYDVKAFYVLLSELYLHKVKKPLPDFDFFLKLHESSFAKCLVVEYEERIIGGVICPIYDTRALYEFYICGEDKAYPKAHPSIMAMWGMVEYADQNGISSIDLMGAGQANNVSSVRQFKSKFGGKLVENGRFLCLNNRFLYALGRFYLRFLSRFF